MLPLSRRAFALSSARFRVTNDLEMELALSYLQAACVPQVGLEQMNALPMLSLPARVVLDSNIVMDMLHYADQYTQRLWAAIQNRQLICYADQQTFAELERVLTYPAFALSCRAQQDLLALYRAQLIFCEAAEDEKFSLPRCRDADDQKFLILAARCAAQVLISRDKELLKLARHKRLPAPFAILTAQATEALL